ncbi:MAG: TRAP transporter small permease subunit, partial [Pseudomonadota bacterium]
IVFLHAPEALRAGRLTRSDGLINILKARMPSIATWLETLFDLVGVAVVGAIFYAHWPILTRAWERNDFVGAVGNFTAPTWPVKAMLAVGAMLLALQFAARILRRHLRDTV